MYEQSHICTLIWFFLFVFNVFFCDIIDTEAFTIIFMCLFPSSGRYRMEQRLIAVIVVSSLPIFLFYSISLFLSLAPSLWVTSRNHLPHNRDISIFSVTILFPFYINNYWNGDSPILLKMLKRGYMGISWEIKCLITVTFHKSPVATNNLLVISRRL